MAACRDAAGNMYAKIGLAADVLDRLPSLQVGCPFEFERVDFVYLPSRKLARIAEKRCHVALRRHHARGEWFFAAANDDAARTAIECFSEIVAAVAGGPVKVGSLDIAVYDQVRRRCRDRFRPNIFAFD
ncbi:GIY-YIG nuclease family protein [Pseudoxanthomonas sp.]|uniref:GIY-YIG nuclease family protein n=1 Tax=Pseudoxanthomonas sp. TaxID=1871049 RepID=UPI003F7EF6B5